MQSGNASTTYTPPHANTYYTPMPTPFMYHLMPYGPFVPDPFMYVPPPIMPMPFDPMHTFHQQPMNIDVTFTPPQQIIPGSKKSNEDITKVEKCEGSSNHKDIPPLVKRVLSWSFSVIKSPSFRAGKKLTRPFVANDDAEYYDYYKTIIAEELRAKIFAGYNKKSQKTPSTATIALIESNENYITISCNDYLHNAEDVVRHNMIINFSLNGYEIFGVADYIVELDLPPQLKIKISSDHQILIKNMHIDSQLELYPLMSMVPDLRMYNLYSQEKLPKPFYSLFSKRLATILPVVYDSDISTVMENSSLICQPNKSQAITISALLKASSHGQAGLFLLQGPPGTGKTTTTTILIKQLLEKHKNWKMLLTAPSNKAVQVLAERLMKVFPKMDVTHGLVAADENKLEQYRGLYLDDSWFKEIEVIFKEPELYTSNLHLMAPILIKLISVKKELLELNGMNPDSFHDGLSNFKSNPSSLQLNLESKIEIINVIYNFLKNLDKKLNGKWDKFLLKQVPIIFATCIISGRSSLKDIKYDAVIVDEASQAVEPMIAVPISLLKNDGFCVLSGDPKQLPAITHSPLANGAEYDKSLMQILMENNQPYCFLDTQYRMLPEICKLPSQLFYNDKLLTAEKVEKQILFKKDYIGSLNKPYLVIDCPQSTEHFDGFSYVNTIEANAVISLIRNLYTNIYPDTSIGVISFYSSQVKYLSALLPKDIYPNVTVQTVDGFQGDERDIIIISSVRSNPKGTVGFLADERRLNVALTRAKQHAYVFCNIATLSHKNSSTITESILADAKSRNVIVNYHDIFRLFADNETKITKSYVFGKRSSGAATGLRANITLADFMPATLQQNKKMKKRYCKKISI